jgi:hypothetical protein
MPIIDTNNYLLEDLHQADSRSVAQQTAPLRVQDQTATISHSCTEPAQQAEEQQTLQQFRYSNKCLELHMQITQRGPPGSYAYAYGHFFFTQSNSHLP